MMQNPEFMMSIMENDPQMRAIFEANPQLRHAMSDPQILRQSMEAMRNPNLYNEMMRNNDRAMANVEALPGMYIAHNWSNASHLLFILFVNGTFGRKAEALIGVLLLCTYYMYIYACLYINIYACVCVRVCACVYVSHVHKTDTQTERDTRQ